MQEARHKIFFPALKFNPHYTTSECCIFSPHEKNRRSLLGDWKHTVTGMKVATMQKVCISYLKRLWIKLQAGNNAENLCSGIRMCGIFPPKAELILVRLPKVEHLDVIAVGNAFVKYVEDKRKETLTLHILQHKKKMYLLVCTVSSLHDPISNLQFFFSIEILLWVKIFGPVKKIHLARKMEMKMTVSTEKILSLKNLTLRWNHHCQLIYEKTQPRVTHPRLIKKRSIPS